MKPIYQYECKRCHTIKTYRSASGEWYARRTLGAICKVCRLKDPESLKNLIRTAHYPEGITKVEMEDNAIMFQRICPTCHKKVYHNRLDSARNSHLLQCNCKSCSRAAQKNKKRGPYNTKPANLSLGEETSFVVKKLQPYNDNPANLSLGVETTHVLKRLQPDLFSTDKYCFEVTFRVTEVKCDSCGWHRIIKLPTTWPDLHCWNCRKKITLEKAVL